MGGHACIAFMEAMGGGLAGQRLANTPLQRLLLAVIGEQIPQFHPVVAKEAQVQLALGAAVVQPAAHLDLLADARGEITDVDVGDTRGGFFARGLGHGLTSRFVKGRHPSMGRAQGAYHNIAPRFSSGLGGGAC